MMFPHGAGGESRVAILPRRWAAVKRPPDDASGGAIFSPQNPCIATILQVEHLEPLPRSANGPDQERQGAFRGVRHPFPLYPKERKAPMDFFSSWTFIIIMLVALIGLVGVLLYLRKQGED
jgi:hypothetical protein